jgi:hypothetical protein
MRTLLISIAAFLLIHNQEGSYTPTSKLTKEEKQGIQLMREEEKMAHDVYSVLFEKWQLRPFSNISGSESRHFEAIGYLLETFEIEDPAINEPGKFRNRELSALYDSLVDKGMESLTAALEVGAFIEEVDIRDLKELIGSTSNENIRTVYSNLLNGSENHLRAFTRNLSWRDATYTPKVLDPAVYAEIAEIEVQPGNGMNCPSSGPKQKKGKGRGGEQSGKRGNSNCGVGHCRQN